MKIMISASILSANFAKLGEEVDAALQAGSDAIHFDVMDHHFVPNLTIGAMVCDALRQHGVTAPIDVHLMVDNPDLYIEAFAKAGANYFVFHPETSTNLENTIAMIQQHNMKVGLAFNPDMPVNIPEALVNHVDMVLLMSVFPGFGGQAFILDVLDKIKSTREWINATTKPIALAVDGGIKKNNIGEVVKAGADWIVIGSGLFNADDYQQRIGELRNRVRGT